MSPKSDSQLLIAVTKPFKSLTLLEAEPAYSPKLAILSLKELISAKVSLNFYIKKKY